MLRLLNRFKRDMLSKGKIKNFLFYTVGEVFLVVVGILIALQIDNWNREVQEEKELKEYLIKIGDNISSDIKLADSLLQRRLKIKEICRQGLQAIHSGEGKNLGLVQKSINLFADFEFSSKTGGYESLVTSGYISKLRKSSPDSLLFQYYLDIEDLQREEKSFNGFVEAMETEINRSFSLFSVYQSEMGYGADDAAIQLAVREYFKLIPLQNAFVRGSFQNAIIRRYRSLIKTGTLLQSEIKKQTTVGGR